MEYKTDYKEPCVIDSPTEYPFSLETTCEKCEMKDIDEYETDLPMRAVWIWVCPYCKTRYKITEITEFAD